MTLTTEQGRLASSPQLETMGSRMSFGGPDVADSQEEPAREENASPIARHYEHCLFTLAHWREASVRTSPCVVSRLRALVALPFFALIAACETPFVMSGEHRVSEVLEAYKDQNETLKSGQHAGIHELYVSIGETPLDSAVTAKLVNAPLSTVVVEILSASGVEHSLDSTSISGRVSANFRSVKLLPALNVLLRQQGFQALENEGIVTLERGASFSGEPDPSFGLFGFIEVPIYHGDPESIMNMLRTLYADSVTQQLQVALHPDKKSVVLKGDEKLVVQAVELVRRAVREPTHVIIESLVVEFNVAAYEKLGSDILGGQTGQLSNITSNIGVKELPALAFSWEEAARNPLEFRAVIEALVSEDEARVVARPYVSTVSGKQAVIHITRDRHVFVQSYAGYEREAPYTSTEAITSGVKLAITPTVLDGGKIRTEVDVEASQFVPPPKDVAVEVNRNFTKSQLEVEDGQTIIVAGLTGHFESLGRSGIPGLRHIPGLNWWSAWREHESERKNVVIFLTPRIWEPGMTLPLVAPDALTAPEGQDSDSIVRDGQLKHNGGVPRDFEGH